MIIKVCGMRDSENIAEVERLDADWMGFIFYSKSPRHVSIRPEYLPSGCKRVGVFVDANPLRILSQVNAFKFDMVQLHGHEDVSYCHDIRSVLPSSTQIIKMVAVTEPDDLKGLEAYEEYVDYFLFEPRRQGYGGSGRQFDWQLLSHYTGSKPFHLSGGIGPEDADKVLSFSHPRFVGIDLNSRFESAPGVKDIQTLKTFIQNIRSHEQN